MKTFKLNAEPRTDLGKKASKELRKENKIPAVLNGGEIVNLPFEGTLEPGQKLVEIANNRAIITTDLIVKEEDVRKLIYTPDIFAIELTFNGKTINAVLKDLQTHPVTDKVIHIDFLEVTDKKPVIMNVPVKLEGHAEGVKAGGKLTLSMKKLKVKAIFTAIPERVVVNVDNIKLGQSLKVGELHYPDYEIVNAKQAVVCAVQLTRAARGAQANANNN